MRPAALPQLLVLLLAGAGCIKVPPIAVVDSRTALELQASGEYPELQFDGADAALEPGPSPVYLPGSTIHSGRVMVYL